MSLSGHSTDGGETEEIHRAEQVGGGGLWRHHAVPAPPGDGAGARLPAEVPGQTNHRLLLLWALGKIGEIADRCKWWILFSLCSVDNQANGMNSILSIYKYNNKVFDLDFYLDLFIFIIRTLWAC